MKEVKTIGERIKEQSDIKARLEINAAMSNLMSLIGSSSCPMHNINLGRIEIDNGWAMLDDLKNHIFESLAPIYEDTAIKEFMGKVDRLSHEIEELRRME